MLSLLSKARCPRCHNERPVRKCSRLNKDIGWDCCNLMRIDLKCPECSYKPRFETEKLSPFPAFKADSFSEADRVCRHYIDLWINKTLPDFEGQTPQQKVTEDKPAFLDWLTKFQYPAYFPLDYLLEKLGYSKLEAQNPPNAEQIACQYMNHVIAMEWDQLVKLSINDRLPDGSELRYQELISSIPTLRKTGDYKVIHGGIAEDQMSAVVFIEIGNKSDWTLIISKTGDGWKLRQHLNGNPKLYFKQNEIYAQIADALSKGEDDKSWNLISEAFKTYPDSADLYYYRGLYWQMVKQLDKAKVDFFNSLALDNYFSPSYFHLAALYLNERNFPEALYWFSQLSQIDPNDPNTLNNIAACTGAMGKTEEARKLWEDIQARFPDFEAARLNLEKIRNGI